MEAGIELLALTEKGITYPAKALDIDVDRTVDEFKLAHSYALNLAVFSAYPTRESIGFLLRKAASNARNLALNAEIITKDNIGLLLAMGAGHANALKLKANI